jgi:hypothetical protein
MTGSYLQPLEPDVAHAVAKFDEAARELFEERAAILEFDAGMPRSDAERKALAMTLDALCANSPGCQTATRPAMG